MSRKPKSGVRNAALYAAVVVSAILIAATAFKWSFMDWLTPFLWLPVYGVVWLAFLAISIWAVIHAIAGRRQWRISLIPTLICAAAIATVLLVPFTQLWLKANFAWYRAEREDVVRKVGDGSLQPNVAHNASLIALDGETWGLSAGGNEIVVEKHDGKTYVFFFTFRGILDNYSGYLFAPDGAEPAQFWDLNEPAVELIEVDDNWFFASHQ